MLSSLTGVLLTTALDIVFMRVFMWIGGLSLVIALFTSYLGMLTSLPAKQKAFQTAKTGQEIYDSYKLAEQMGVGQSANPMDGNDGSSTGSNTVDVSDSDDDEFMETESANMENPDTEASSENSSQRDSQGSYPPQPETPEPTQDTVPQDSGDTPSQSETQTASSEDTEVTSDEPDDDNKKQGTDEEFEDNDDFDGPPSEDGLFDDVSDDIAGVGDDDTTTETDSATSESNDSSVDTESDSDLVENIEYEESMKEDEPDEYVGMTLNGEKSDEIFEEALTDAHGEDATVDDITTGRDATKVGNAVQDKITDEYDLTKTDQEVHDMKNAVMGRKGVGRRQSLDDLDGDVEFTDSGTETSEGDVDVDNDVDGDTENQ